MHKLFISVARAIAILGIGFISMFALDVFGTGAPATEVAIALFMHLLPSLGLLAVLAVAWRWPLIGGIMFCAIAMVPFLIFPNPLWVNALLAGPFALAGLLFMAGAAFD